MEIEFCLDNTLNTAVDNNLYIGELLSSTKNHVVDVYTTMKYQLLILHMKK